MGATSFLLYCFMVTFTPGPTNIVILTTTQNYGSKKALQYTYGSTVAFFILLVLSAIFNTILVNIMPNVILAMKIIGTIYMIYLCYQILKSKDSSSQKNYGNFISGFSMQFLNPKVVLFCLTVIPSFVLTPTRSYFEIFVNVIIITTIAFSAFILWLLFGSILKKFINQFTNIFNITMAILLLLATTMIWF